MSKIIKISLRDKQYPEQLREIANPPPVLYCRGSIELLKTSCFGVVGTRKATQYGSEATNRLVGHLAGFFTIVSGLALGIDALAHKAALEFGGKTIAVLGSGIDDKNIYPRTNFNLAKDILSKNGLLISEYPEGFHANEKTFPQRNRIISGISKGVLIVEADQESGSLITARLAAEQNRDVFAVPGSIFSRQSRGANQIIQKGAKLVNAPEDILEEYQSNPTLFESSPRDLSTRDEDDKKILVILDENGEQNTDEIVRKSGLEASTVISKLSLLELHGIVKESNGKYRLI